MNIYTVWTKSGTGINEKCIMNDIGNYIGINTGVCYNSFEHYHSEQFKAQIIAADSFNNTGMIHLYDHEDTKENKREWKTKYIGCFVTVEKAHMFGELYVYRCLELGEYWSSNEIKILE